jgi:putative tryptophan/tyrosine transport system substrate-binding protein
MTLRTALKLSTLLVLCLTAAMASAADGSGEVARIVIFSVSEAGPVVIALGQRLHMLRSADGKSYTVEFLSAQGRSEQLAEIAAELVRSKVDVIVAFTNLPAFAAKNATRSIPIVVFGAHDAVGTGLARSLARPGSNITGTESLAPELDAKRMQLIKQMIPTLKDLAVLYNPDDQGSPIHLKWAQDVSQTLGFRISRLEVRRASDFDAVLRNAASQRPDALLMLTDQVTGFNWRYVDEFAQRNRVPTVCEFSRYVDGGCLISYGPTFDEINERVAQQVDRILKGAKPADMPFEQPTRFELVVNRKTAAALGISIPQAILLQATRVVD